VNESAAGKFNDDQKGAKNMRKTTAFSAMLMLVGALCAAFATAQTTPDLSGVWKMNPTKSKAERPLPSGIKIKFDQKDSSFKETLTMTFGENEQSVEYEYGADGKEVELKDPKAPYTITAKWEGKTLVQTLKQKGKSQGFTRKFTLSDDGKSLLCVIENPNADGSKTVDTLFLEKQ
jgi:hypothetical protein